MSSPLVHYDAVAGHAYTLAARVHLPTYALREHNNAQKRSLLKKFVPPNAVILDLAGGKGGDLHKFAALNAAVVHLVDQSAESVSVARERFEKMHPPYPFIFSTGCASFTDESAYPPVHGLVDVVSCQFAFHYLHPEDYTWVLQRVARALKPAGVFLCTVPNPRKIEKFRNNKICRIVAAPPLRGAERYSFYLQGAVGDCTRGVLEYKVEYAALCSAATSVGLQLVHYREYETSDSLRWDENAVATLYCEYGFIAKKPVSEQRQIQEEASSVATQRGWCPLRGQVVEHVISDGFRAGNV